MACENKVDYFIIDNTFDYKKVQVPCGMTNPHGERAVCHICIKDRNKMESLRQQITQYFQALVGGKCKMQPLGKVKQNALSRKWQKSMRKAGKAKARQTAKQSLRKG